MGVVDTLIASDLGAAAVGNVLTALQAVVGTERLTPDATGKKQ